MKKDMSKCLRKFICFKWYKHDFEAYDRYEKELYRKGSYPDAEVITKVKVYEKEKCLNCGKKREIYLKTVTTTYSNPI